MQLRKCWTRHGDVAANEEPRWLPALSYARTSRAHAKRS